MRRSRGAWKVYVLIAACLVLASQSTIAQKKAVTATPGDTRKILEDKARALEARGRPDMAIQEWQRVLLSDPQNAEGLAGIARCYKLSGATDKATAALERLRQANPNDPNIAKIEQMPSTRVQSDRLSQAGELAKQGKLEDAMKIYRDLYGDQPPGGDIGLAYYQTLYGTSSGKEEAIKGMRALADRNPGDTRFPVQLGIMLTYEARTRAEGIRLLEAHPKDAEAQAGLRQALIWDAANPGSAAELRKFLKEHPQDTEIAGHLREDEFKLAQMNSGIARTPDERAAFAALNGRRLEEAQLRFEKLIAKDPNNGRVLAGMGFVRMQQSNFGGAISFLTQAEQKGYKDRAVETALVTSRFWYTMGEASQAFDENQMDLSASKYKAALAMRPRSPEALIGVAGLLVKEQQYPAAALVYGQLVKVQPASAPGWRGLFLAYARDGQNEKALDTASHFPAGPRATLAKDPEYLRTLAGVYQAMGKPEDARRTLVLALSLPFPENGTALKEDTRLQYAGILMEAKRYDQAAELYTQILNEDPASLSAWMGLVDAHHEMAQDAQAIADVEKIPAATYERALADPAFLQMLGSIYQQGNQLEVAQGFLERAAKMEIAAGVQPSIPLRLQMAAIDLQRNNTAEAYTIYRQVLTEHPERADAWKGLIATLQSTNRNAEALQELAQIPPQVRKELDKDIDFVQGEASLYASAGEIPRAIEYMNRVQAHYAALKIEPPANVAVQNAWLLYNTQNDRALYPALMRLGGRRDLTVAQRETVQTIWASWSVRRAGVALDNGNVRRALEILEVANQAFPENMAVRKAIAGGYVLVGRAKESLALYKSVSMQDATAGDFQGAVGAALAANDRNQAEFWLRQALERYPRDPAILQLAARFEQARGDNQRAAEYWRASLAAMPRVSVADKLAHELVYPEQDLRVRRAATPADLQRLLDPNEEPFAKTTKLPALPAYGPDPALGAPPVVVIHADSVPEPSRWTSAPSTTDLAIPAAPAARAPVESASPAGAQPVAPRESMPSAPLETVPAAPAAQATPAQTPSSTPEALPVPSTIPSETAPSAAPQEMNPPAANPPAEQTPQPESQPGASPAPEGNPPADKPIEPNPKVGNSSYFQGALHLVSTMALVSQEGTAQPAEPSGSSAPQENLERILVPDKSNLKQEQTPTGAPHSLASDAWKGLVFSLQAGNRTAEALQQISQIPPDIRRQLESDVDFEQVEASLYLANGDTQRAMDYMNRVQNYYVVHRLTPPPSVEMQNAWLFYNNGNDRSLYATLVHLDSRTDLTAAQQADVQTIWGNWSVRRAAAAIQGGNLLRAVTILEAALTEFPNNLNVRRAVAGGYVQVGRFADALSIFKSLPMQEASSGDMQGAIAAALGANDMAQAESWLRDALARFPADPAILSAAARFEQARGNNQRAIDFWKAAIAAMPPGASIPRYDSTPGSYGPVNGGRPPVPGDLKRLLDPGSSWPQSSLTPSPLPGSGGRRYPGAASFSAPAGQGTLPRNAPLYIIRDAAEAPYTGQPTLIEQNWTGEAKFALVADGVQKSSGSDSTGTVHLPASEENIDSTDSAAPAPKALPIARAASPASKPSILPSTPAPSVGLRISSQPMGRVAAQVQALFADQTDGQLTQGSATAIRATPTIQITAVPVPAYASTQGVLPSSGAAPNPATVPSPRLAPAPSPTARYTVAQYTPSAQEAATGAYSTPRPQVVNQPPPQKPAAQQQQMPQETPAPRAKRSKKAKKAAEEQKSQQVPTLATAPSAPAQRQQMQPVEVGELPAAPTQETTTIGLTDEELQQRNLPPLRGPWVRVDRARPAVSPRDEAEMQLRSIESGYSGWFGGSGILNYRSGSPGFDRLAALEAPFEVSLPLGYTGRFTIVAKPVFLDSGAADGTSVLIVQEQGTSSSKLVSIPQPIGTETATDTNPPAQQNAAGIGGELQLAFKDFAIAGGYTPAGFLVATFTGRLQWRPAHGPFTFNFSRDSVKDTQLSYAGLRDPAGNTLSTQGQIWGGVTANQGNLQFARGDQQSGMYIGAGGQYLTGYMVQDNIRIDGTGGAYWRVLSEPEFGTLSVGANFFGMHYDHNQDAFTHGMGGYFSPQAYFLANVPLSWNGHYGTKWHYNIMGGLGVQAFQEDLTKLYPLASDSALEIAMDNASLPAKTSVAANYDLRTQAAYQIGPHWFVGGFLNANNSRNYSSVSTGFSLRYLFRSQPSTVAGPTGIFPVDGLRPFAVP
jgi:tetratricopeptide (TPR) repeat protein